jgi:Fe-S cluster assembly protein SufD
MSPTSRIQSRLEKAARDWLADDVPAAEPEWLARRRSTAREYFQQQGIPTIRQEDFRFFPLSGITSEALHSVSRVQTDMTLERPEWASAACFGFVNGQPIGLTGSLPSGLRIERLSDVLNTAPNALEPYLGNLAVSNNGFAAVGLSLFRDAWVVRVAEGVSIELPLDVVIQQRGGGQWAIPRLLVVMESGSQLKLIERRVSDDSSTVDLTTGVFELFLGERAQLQHVRLCSRGGKAAEMTATAVRVAANGHYHAWTATNKGMLTRFDTHVRLAGVGARADLDGLYVASGSDIVDHHTRVVHASENTTVEESYKGIIDDQAQAVFDGQIVVQPGAMGTNAQQYNRNLLMSDHAVVHTKPQLEIDADDVACSHGATVGKLDEQQLFYLQSRGISGEQAKRMLTTAFAAEVLDRCPVKQVAQFLTGFMTTLSLDTEPLFGNVKPG